MYKITGVTDEDKALIIEALQSPTREFKQRVSFGYWTATDGVRSFNKSFEVTSVSSASIKQLVCSDSSMLTFGCCCAGSAELEFFNPNYGETKSAEAKYSGKIIFIEQGIKYKDGTDSDGNEYYYFFPLGYFKTQSPSSDDKWFTIKVSAYDDIYLMTNKYTSELFSDGTQSVSALSLINELAGRYNLAVDFDENSIAEQYILNQRSLTADEAEILTAYSDAEALGYLAGLAGANARINTVGKLHVGWYSAAESYTMPTKIQWQNGFVKKAEEAFEINSVTLGIDDTVYTSGTGKGLSAVNPLVKENDAAMIRNWLFASVPPISFLPCEIEWRGDPRIEAGDLISVYDENGTTYDIFVAEQDLDLTGGLSAKIMCPTGAGEMSFDTVSENTRKELNRQKTTLQQAIEKATNAINGAKGGFFEVRDDDDDGNPDGWIIKENEGGTGGIIRANQAGIGLSTDGGHNYQTAITFNGINAKAINCDDLFAISAKIGGWNISENCIYNELSTADDTEVVFACGVEDSDLEKSTFALYKSGKLKMGGKDYGYVTAEDSALKFYSPYTEGALTGAETSVISGTIGSEPYVNSNDTYPGNLRVMLRPLNFDVNGNPNESNNSIRFGRNVTGFLGDPKDPMPFSGVFEEYVRITDGETGGYIHTGVNTIDLCGREMNKFAGLIHHRTINNTESMVKYGVGGVGTEPSIACEVWHSDELQARIDVYKDSTSWENTPFGTVDMNTAIRVGHENTSLQFGTDSMAYDGNALFTELSADAIYVGGNSIWEWLSSLDSRISNLGG